MGVICTHPYLCGGESGGQGCQFWVFLIVNSEQSWKPDTQAILCTKRHQEWCSVFAITRKNSVWIRISKLKQTLDFLGLEIMN